MSDKMDTEARKMYDDAIEVIIIHWVFQYSGTIFNDFKEIKFNLKKKPRQKNHHQPQGLFWLCKF